MCCIKIISVSMYPTDLLCLRSEESTQEDIDYINGAFNKEYGKEASAMISNYMYEIHKLESDDIHKYRIDVPENLTVEEADTFVENLQTELEIAKKVKVEQITEIDRKVSTLNMDFERYTKESIRDIIQATISALPENNKVFVFIDPASTEDLLFYSKDKKRPAVFCNSDLDIEIIDSKKSLLIIKPAYEIIKKLAENNIVIWPPEESIA